MLHQRGLNIYFLNLVILAVKQHWLNQEPRQVHMKMYIEEDQRVVQRIGGGGCRKFVPVYGGNDTKKPLPGTYLTKRLVE